MPWRYKITEGDGFIKGALVFSLLLLLLVSAACEENGQEEREEDDLKAEEADMDNDVLERSAGEVDLARREKPFFLTEDAVVYAGIGDEYMGTEDEQDMWEIFYHDLANLQAERLYSDVFVGDLPLMKVSGDYFFFPSAPDELEVMDEELNTVDVLAATWARHYPDAEAIYFKPIGQMGEEQSLERYHLNTQSTEEVFTGGDYLELVLLDEHRGGLYVEDEEAHILKEIQLDEAGETREITRFEKHLLALEGGYVAPREEVLFFSAWETEAGVNLFVYDMDGNQVEEIALEGFEPDLRLSPTGKNLLIITSDKGGPMTRILQLEDMELTEAPEMNHGAWSPDGARLVFETPLREVQLYDLETGEVEDIPLPEVP